MAIWRLDDAIRRNKRMKRLEMTAEQAWWMLERLREPKHEPTDKVKPKVSMKTMRMLGRVTDLVESAAKEYVEARERIQDELNDAVTTALNDPSQIGVDLDRIQAPLIAKANREFRVLSAGIGRGSVSFAIEAADHETIRHEWDRDWSDASRDGVALTIGVAKALDTAKDE